MLGSRREDWNILSKRTGKSDGRNSRWSCQIC
ncbi:hypothetical protein LINPERPRIM_LOCUS38658 [Linum perenne]